LFYNILVPNKNFKLQLKHFLYFSIDPPVHQKNSYHMMIHLQISNEFSFKLIPASNMHIPYQQMECNYLRHNPEYNQINIFL
jgi:hypothetical protein